MPISVQTPDALPSFFDGVPTDAVAELLECLETRTFPAGSIVVDEGDFPRQIYLAESGAAEAIVADRRVGEVHSGTTIGEMSLFTGEPAAATVRAVDDLVVRVLTERELERIATAHPQVYRNLAAIIAGRLARTNRLAAQQESGKLVVVQAGAPSLAYALAASVAWHSRESTVLVVLGEAPELEPFADDDVARSGARVVFAPIESERSIESLIESLAARYAHVIVLARRGIPSGLSHARTVALDHRLELSAADEEALRDGVLPASTDAGRVLGRVARDIGGLTVGLALGAGSMRGYAHAGVLRGLERIGLEVDYICGTSIGAAVAAAHAMGYGVDEVEVLIDRCARTLFRPRVPIKGFMSSGPLARSLRDAYRGLRIEELPLPLGLVAADLPTHREIVFRRGPIWRAVVASVSIPGVYPAQRMGPYVLVDGGVVNSVPAGVASDMGAANVIAVRLVGPPDAPEMDAEAVDDVGRAPSALIAILRSIEIMQARTSREGGAATVTITPDLSNVPGSKLRNFGEGKPFTEAGEAAFEAALPRIASVLPWLRT